MDSKIVVIGPGPAPRWVDALTEQGHVVELKTRGDFLGDVQVLPTRPPKEPTFNPRRRTGAAAIKRASKKARRK